jgi:hypothetical protein
MYWTQNRQFIAKTMTRLEIKQAKRVLPLYIQASTKSTRSDASTSGNECFDL